MTASLELVIPTDRQGVYTYGVRLLPAGPGEVLVVELAKRGGPEVYRVVFREGGWSACTCRGWLRWRHCKHCTAIVEVGLVPENRGASGSHGERPGTGMAYGGRSSQVAASDERNTQEPGR
jgi:hypothetical protein